MSCCIKEDTVIPNVISRANLFAYSSKILTPAILISAFSLLLPSISFAQGGVDCAALAEEKLLPKLERANEKATKKHAGQVVSFEKRGENSIFKARKKVQRMEKIVRRICGAESTDNALVTASNSTGKASKKDRKCEKAKSRYEAAFKKEQRIAQNTAKKVADAVARADAALRKTLDSNDKRYAKARDKFIRKCEARKGL